jgi:hypothetical protein
MESSLSTKNGVMELERVSQPARMAIFISTLKNNGTFLTILPMSTTPRAVLKTGSQRNVPIVLIA